MVVSIAVGILRAYRIIPDERWTELFPLGIFYILLFFWQHLRELFKKPLVVFLDRLCIAQNDDRLKEQGILGLAGQGGGKIGWGFKRGSKKGPVYGWGLLCVCVGGGRFRARYFTLRFLLLGLKGLQPKTSETV